MMTTQEFLSSVGLILAVMASVAVVEVAVPLLARPTALPGRRRANLLMTIQTLSFAFVLNSAVAAAALVLPFASPRLMTLAGLPGPAQLVLGIVVLDFMYGYVAHRSMHAWPSMWKFHRVHDSDPFVDVTTSYRIHPFETAWRHLLMFAAVWLLGVPVAAVVGFRVLSAINGIFEHANIRVKAALDTALSWIWVTPNMHKVHHSRTQIETGSNFGNLFSIHDRVLGTFLPTERALSVTCYGVDDVDPAETTSFVAMLALPWRADLETTSNVETIRAAADTQLAAGAFAHHTCASPDAR